MSKEIKKTTISKKSTKIGKNNIQQLIKEEAEVIKRKREIYEQIKAFNKELGELNKKGLGKLGLNERVMTVGAQGFGSKIPGAVVNPTGFVYPQNISRVAELEAELAPDETVVLDGPENKEMIDMPADKQIVDGEVKKQLIDMRDKLDMILSSITGGDSKNSEGSTETIVDAGEEANQAAAQTETPDEDSEEQHEEEPEKEEEEEKEDSTEEEEEEIVIKENKTKKPIIKK